jgi:hypothetical protein
MLRRNEGTRRDLGEESSGRKSRKINGLVGI